MLLDGTTNLERGRTAASDAAAETAYGLLDGVWPAPVGIAFLDRDLRFVQVNEAFARLSGVAPPAHAGKAPRDLFAAEREVVARAEERLRAVVASGRPALDVTASCRTPAGALRSWRASLYPVFAPGGQVRGVCAVVDETTHVHEREVTLERARAAVELVARRLALVQRLTAALSAAVTASDVAAAVLEHVGAATGAAAAALWIVEREGLAPLAAEGPHGADADRGRVIPRGAALPVADAARGEEGIWLESAGALSSRYPELTEIRRREGYEACAALPLRAGGADLGTLSLEFREPRSFDLEERAFLLGLAQHCAQALDRARAFEAERAALADARRAADRLAALQAVTAALARARTPHDVEQVFVEGATFVCGADRAVVYTREPGRDVVTRRVRAGVTDGEASRRGAIPIASSHPVAQAIRTREASWLESRDEVVAAFPELAHEPQPWPGSAVAIVPLLGHDILGVGALLFRRARELGAGERDLLGSIAEQCGQALERAWLLERERTLRAAAERDRAVLDGIFENAPLGIGLLDRDLRFVRVNPIFARMNGAPAEAHVGRTPPEVAALLGWEEIGSALRRVAETGVPRLDAPVSMPGPDGKDRHFLEAWYPVRATGETVGLGAIIREVTAERDAQEFQRNVLGIVGHDVRTPLATIATAAHLLRGVEPLTDRQDRLVARIASGAAHIERVVSLLVDYAQAHAGQALPVRPRACDLAALCRSAAEECEAAQPGRRVRCEGGSDATGEWDADRLGQALGNLLSNALDYSPPGTPVDVRWRGTPDAVEVEVANEGAPIPPEALSRMFEPFERGKRDHSGRRGLGLGLFIARAIARAHGGQLSARSEEGRTAFTIRLPRAVPAPRV
jgi:PAS domain S-box-containing protein